MGCKKSREQMKQLYTIVDIDSRSMDVYNKALYWPRIQNVSTDKCLTNIVFDYYYYNFITILIRDNEVKDQSLQINNTLKYNTWLPTWLNTDWRRTLTGTRILMWGRNTVGWWWIRIVFRNDRVSIFMLELEFLSLKVKNNRLNSLYINHSIQI